MSQTTTDVSSAAVDEAVARLLVAMATARPCAAVRDLIGSNDVAVGTPCSAGLSMPAPERARPPSVARSD